MLIKCITLVALIKKQLFKTTCRLANIHLADSSYIPAFI